MRRRDVIILLGGATVAVPLPVRAQQRGVPIIGYIGTSFSATSAAFRTGLTETGYIEGRDVIIEYRWTEGRYDRLPVLVDDLVRLNVAVISAGGNVAAMAAKRGTSTIPIVFNVAADPVRLGLVASLRHPGGNATGIALLTGPLTVKRLELISELVARDATVGILVNPDNEGILRDVQDAAPPLGRRVFTVKARAVDEFEAAFAALAKARVSGLLVANDAFFFAERKRIIALARRAALPAIYEFPEFPAEGGLMSYGPNLADIYRRIGMYVGRILAGAKPGELPVEQPTKFGLVINLKTANALGLVIPQSILLRADEVIE